MSTQNSYRLINPYVEGTVNTVVKARNPFNAGKKLYNTISSYFTNHVDDFYMTVQNLETKKLEHFKINEKRSENGGVSYSLLMLDKSFGKDLDKKFIGQVEKTEKQNGGKKIKLDDSDSDSESDSESSSESDNFKFPSQPINKFVYFYLPYYKLYPIELKTIDMYRIFIPTFSLPVNPTIEFRMDFIY